MDSLTHLGTGVLQARVRMLTGCIARINSDLVKVNTALSMIDQGNYSFSVKVCSKDPFAKGVELPMLSLSDLQQLSPAVRVFLDDRRRQLVNDRTRHDEQLKRVCDRLQALTRTSVPCSC